MVKWRNSGIIKHINLRLFRSMLIYNYVEIEHLIQKRIFLRFLLTSSILLATVKVLNRILTQIFWKLKRIINISGSRSIAVSKNVLPLLFIISFAGVAFSSAVTSDPEVFNFFILKRSRRPVRSSRSDVTRTRSWSNEIRLPRPVSKHCALRNLLCTKQLLFVGTGFSNFRAKTQIL